MSQVTGGLKLQLQQTVSQLKKKTRWFSGQNLKLI